MILLTLDGGLGNQLFQYALGRRLALDRNENLRLDLTEFSHIIEGKTPRTYRLDHFNISAQVATPLDIARFRSSALTDRVRRRILRAFLPTHAYYTVYEKTPFVYDLSLFQKKENLCLRGYWQHPAYFASIANVIRQDLTIKTPPTPQNTQMLQHIRAVNAVSLHIRRGDYASNPNATQFHGLMGLDYYHEAVKQLSEQISTPHFFIFSDDIPWAKENLHLPYPMTFVDHNNEETDYEDLRLMTNCQHHIIANSSFSWWGAWLAQHPHQIVFAPKQWTRDHTSQDIALQSWTRL